jgi:hypothetical protein
MLARGKGRQPRKTPRGQVFRVEMPRLEPGSGTLQRLSDAWNCAVARAEQAMTAGSIVAAVGEAGSGRATLLGQAARHTYPRDRILSASAPGPSDIQTWFGLWAPELGKANTAMIVRDVDMLPAWVAERMRSLVLRGSGATSVPVAVTAERYEDIPAALAGLVDKVVLVPPLRDRSDDVVPLAQHVAMRVRGREIDITPSAARALRSYDWPGNIDELTRVISHAVVHADLIDFNHLPPEVLAAKTRHLSRIEAFERGEIVRVLSDDGLTMAEAAAELGMSRATLYRKIAQYDIQVPRESG